MIKLNQDETDGHKHFESGTPPPPYKCLLLSLNILIGELIFRLHCLRRKHYLALALKQVIGSLYQNPTKHNLKNIHTKTVFVMYAIER